MMLTVRRKKHCEAKKNIVRQKKHCEAKETMQTTVHGPTLPSKSPPLVSIRRCCDVTIEPKKGSQIS